MKIIKTARYNKIADHREYSHYPDWIKEDWQKMALVIDGFAVDEREDLICPAKATVCPVCDGKGSHVNPSIDSHGIGQEEFDEDPQFQQDYFSGVHDISCSTCKGKRVVLAPIDPNSECAKIIEDSITDQYNSYQEQEAERRMGA